MARQARQNVSMLSTADKTQVRDADPFFPVAQEQLKTSRGIDSGIYAVVRQDNGEVLGQYKGEKMLPYRTLVDSFENELNNQGITFKRSFTTAANGARLYGRYDIESGLTVGRETFNGFLTLQACYDSKFQTLTGYDMMNLRCLNTVEGFTRMAELHGKVSNDNVRLVNVVCNVRGLIESGQRLIAESIDRMNTIELTNDDARNVISNIVAKGAIVGVSERAGYLIHHNWINPDEHESELGNTFNRLYNAATRFTRDVQNVGRFELGKRAGRYIGGAFHLATSQQHALQALLATPVKPLDFDNVTVNV